MLEEKKLTFHSAHFLSAGSGNGAGQHNNSLLWSLGQLPDYESSSLDYMLALSLQSEGDLEDPRQEGVWTDVWDRRLGRTPAPSNLTSQLSSSTNNNCTAASPKTNPTVGHSPSSNIMLPCEFCEELFPVEDLILHQVSDEASIIPSRYTHSWLDI